jgi:hypothetical protein
MPRRAAPHLRTLLNRAEAASPVEAVDVMADGLATCWAPTTCASSSWI